jgi:hypothetical protein
VFAGQQATGNANWVFHPFDGGHRAYLVGVPIHHPCVKLHHAVLVKMGAKTCIKGRVVLHRDDGRLHGV